MSSRHTTRIEDRYQFWIVRRTDNYFPYYGSHYFTNFGSKYLHLNRACTRNLASKCTISTNVSEFSRLSCVEKLYPIKMLYGIGFFSASSIMVYFQEETLKLHRNDNFEFPEYHAFWQTITFLTINIPFLLCRRRACV